MEDCWTVAVKVRVAPAFTEVFGEIASVVVVASGTGAPTEVTSLALSFSVLISPPPETLAALVTEEAASFATLTVTVMTG